MRELAIPALPCPAVVDITIPRDEPLALLFAGAVRLALTIAATPAGAALIEVPAAGERLTIQPGDVQALAEGGNYHFNLWAEMPDRVLAARGRLSIGPSISPSWADWSTTWLNNFGQPGGPARVVAMSLPAYLAITPDPDTIYLITGG